MTGIGQVPGGTIRRVILVVPIMLVALWAVVAFTASAALSRISPDLAVLLDPGNSRALERAASVDAATMNTADARRALQLARRSLVTSPLSSEGAAALADATVLLAPRADLRPAFEYSQFLSRRVVPTEAWFVQYFVARGDVTATLREYDRLLRASDFSLERFLPILIAASANRPVAVGMARLLAARPPWRGNYFGGLLATFPGADNFALLVRDMHFDPADADEAMRLRLAFMRLVDAGRPDLAGRLYADVRKQATPVLLHDGDFTDAGNLPPFDWQLTESDDMLAAVGTDDSGRTVLQLVNKGARPGPLARQLLLLSPGRYRLSFSVGDVGGDELDRPKMLLRCLAGDRNVLAVPFPTATAAGSRVALAFVIPSQGCRAQWLIVQAGNPVNGGTDRQWLGGVHIETLAPTRPSAD